MNDDTPVSVLLAGVLGLPAFSALTLGSGIEALDAIEFWNVRGSLGNVIIGYGAAAICFLITAFMVGYWLLLCWELLRRAFKRKKAP